MAENIYISKPALLLSPILAVDFDERSKLMIGSRQNLFFIIQNIFLIYGAAARYRRGFRRGGADSSSSTSTAVSISFDGEIHPQHTKIVVGAAAELNQLKNCVHFWLCKAARGFHRIQILKGSDFLGVFCFIALSFRLLWKAWMLNKPGI